MTKDEWIKAAYTRFVRWAKHRKAHGAMGTLESLRSHVERDIEPPRDGRWWGAVCMSLARDGVIVKTHRFEAARSSNMSPKPVWRVRGGC